MVAEVVMNEEVLRIQKMVAEGKITPEESVELLESVGTTSAPKEDRTGYQEESGSSPENVRTAEKVRNAQKGTQGDVSRKESDLDAVQTVGQAGINAGILIAVGPVFFVGVFSNLNSTSVCILVGLAILGGSCVAAISAFFSLRHLGKSQNRAKEQ